MNRSEALAALDSQLLAALAELERAETVYCTLLGGSDDVLAGIQRALAEIEAAAYEVVEERSDIYRNQPRQLVFDADRRHIELARDPAWRPAGMPWRDFTNGLHLRWPADGAQ